MKEVGFPDNVLEARVARINMYHTLVSESEQKETKSEPEVAVSVVKYGTANQTEVTGEYRGVTGLTCAFLVRYGSQRYRHHTAVPLPPSHRYSDRTHTPPT